MYNIGFIVILYQKIKNSIFLKQKIISLINQININISKY